MVGSWLYVSWSSAIRDHAYQGGIRGGMSGSTTQRTEVMLTDRSGFPVVKKRSVKE